MKHNFYGQYIFPTDLVVCWETVENFCVVYISEIACFIWGTAAVFWDVTPCILLEIYVRFGGTIRFHLQGRWPTSQKTRIDQAATIYQTYAFSHVKNEPKVDCV
jgi:hypothetical protein